MSENNNEKPQAQDSANQTNTTNKPASNQSGDDVPNPNIQAPTFISLTEGLDPKNVAKKNKNS